MSGEEAQTLNQGMSSKARDEVFSVGSRSGRRRVKGWVVQWAVACGVVQGPRVELCRRPERVPWFL